MKGFSVFILFGLFLGGCSKFANDSAIVAGVGAKVCPEELKLSAEVKAYVDTRMGSRCPECPSQAELMREIATLRARLEQALQEPKHQAEIWQEQLKRTRSLTSQKVTETSEVFATVRRTEAKKIYEQVVSQCAISNTQKRNGRQFK